MSAMPDTPGSAAPPPSTDAPHPARPASPTTRDPYATPAMEQFRTFKRQRPDCLLFFRMGDFYEMFGDDAIRAGAVLGLTVTERTKGIPMAGVPHHQKNRYLQKLVDAGVIVAIVDQLEDPKTAKGVVKRGITQIITPGTIVDETMLSESEAAAVAAIVFLKPGDRADACIAIADLSTGTLVVDQGEPAAMIDQLAAHSVRELLFAEVTSPDPPARVARCLDALGIVGTPRPGWQFTPDEARQELFDQYAVASFEGFGFAHDDPRLTAAGVLVRFLREMQAVGIARLDELPTTLAHLRPPRALDRAGVCRLDAVSLRALEVERTIRSGSVAGSLAGVFLGSPSVCATAMGKRTLRSWLCQPLADRSAIEARQRCVATLVDDRRSADELAQLLAGVQDVARLSGRIALGRASPRDLVALGVSIGAIDGLIDALDGADAFSSIRSVLIDQLGALEPLAQRITSSCTDCPPVHLREGGLIRDGVDAQLDEARSLGRDADAWLARYQGELIERYDLPSLKVGYNKVFGYYIELPSAQAKRAPPELTRKQTLKNAERFITPQLHEFERQVTTALDRAIARESALYADLCEAVRCEVEALDAFARAVGELDALAGFASKAHRRSWARPTIVDEPVLAIQAGRHPVLDESLNAGFVPNDLTLSDPADDPRNGATLALLTGPNMAGKSTYIRQNALIALLALAGSFVPADAATVGVCDRIFTRVGADDALHAGQSTFMVEMIETANILNHATARSLVILDEIGRGTSTLDGLSLAWAIAEHLAALGARTLFATHYHELTGLEEELAPAVRNLRVLVREWDEQIVFLHRIEPGRADQSYGVQVARLAGLPRAVTDRARELLCVLSVEHAGRVGTPADRPTRPADQQMPLFGSPEPHPAIDQLREVKLDSLTPLEAFDELRRLRALIEPIDPAD